MAELVSMKRTPNEIRERSTGEKVCETPGSTDLYPYGLEIRLEKESMSKLGDQIEALVVGANVRISAEAKVESMQISEKDTDKGKESDASAILQITSLAIDGVIPLKKTIRELRKAIR